MSAKVEYEKTSYSTLERIVYLVVIPIVVFALLMFILLSIFGVDVKNSLLKVGNNIPIVQNWVPEPAESAAPSFPEQQVQEEHQELLLAELREVEQLLVEEVQKTERNEQYISELQLTIEQLEAELETKLLSEEEYGDSVRQLAHMYANMTPSRAADIIQNLTLHEQVLVLNEMASADQIRILEKMNPVAAAEASILLKDLHIVKDIQIAALQERLAIHSEEEAAAATLSAEELALTFASMTPNNAATVLVEMIQINENKVVDILRAMDVQARSRILNAITDLSGTEAAKLTAKLG